MNTIEMNQYFITAAYAVTWVVILAYLARLVRKNSQIRADYDRMTLEAGAEARR